MLHRLTINIQCFQTTQRYRKTCRDARKHGYDICTVGRTIRIHVPQTTCTSNREGGWMFFFRSGICSFFLVKIKISFKSRSLLSCVSTQLNELWTFPSRDVAKNVKDFPHISYLIKLGYLYEMSLTSTLVTEKMTAHKRLLVFFSLICILGASHGHPNSRT